MIRTILMQLITKLIGPLLIIGVLCAGIWFIGDWFDWSSATRYLLMAIVTVLVILVQSLRVYLQWRRKRRIQQQLDQVAQAAPLEADEEEPADLAGRFDRAMGLIAQAGRREEVLQQGWYVVAGPSGAGKSSLLRGARLDLPNIGLDPAARGPTEEVDWWVSDQGVFLDTAGRLCEDDRAGWRQLMQLVTHHRGGLAGLVFCLDAGELLQLGEEGVGELGRRLRERVDDACESCATVLPVYLVLTKTDRLRGFVPFFADLSSEQRDRAAGLTLSFRQCDPETLARDCGERFDLFYARLRMHRVPALAACAGPDDRRGALTFPNQLSTLQDPLRRLVEAYARPRPFQETGLLRGIHFTSLRQEGVPLDPLRSGADAVLAVGDEPGALQVDEQRAFFAHGLVRDVLPVDRELPYLRGEEAGRARLRSRLAAVGSLVIGLLLLAGMAVSFVANGHDLTRTAAAAAAVREQEQGIATLKASLMELDPMLRRLRLLDRRERQGEPWRLDFALYQGDAAYALLRQAYYRRTRELLLMPVIERLAADLDAQLGRFHGGGRNGLDYYRHLYRGYRGFAMLTGSLPADRATLGALLRGERDGPVYWSEAILATRPGDHEADGEVATMLDAHLDYLLGQCSRSEEWLPREPSADRYARLDRNLRRTLTEEGAWADLVYAALIEEALAPGSGYGRSIGEQLLSGPSMRAIFSYHRAPQRLFTTDGYEEYLRGAIAERAAWLAERYRLLAADGEPHRSAGQIADHFRDLYARAWTEQWRRALTGLRIEAVDDVEAAKQLLDVLAAADSPYGALLGSIARAQVLSYGDLDVRNRPGFDPAGEWFAAVRSHLGDCSLALAAYRNTTTRGQRLQQIEQLEALAEAFETAAGEIATAVATAGDTQEAAAIDGHMRSILAVAIGGVGAELADEAQRLWRSRVVDHFEQRLAARFPFAIEAPSEQSVGSAAFNAFFDPEEGRLAAVERRFAAVQAVQCFGAPILRLAPAYRDTIDRAHAIHALFRGGPQGQEPGLRFTVHFLQRSGVEDLRLSIGTEQAGLYDDPLHMSELSWGFGDHDGARVAARVAGDRWLAIRAPADPWGPLHLIKAGEASRLDERRTHVRWLLGDVQRAQPQAAAAKPEPEPGPESAAEATGEPRIDTRIAADVSEPEPTATAPSGRGRSRLQRWGRPRQAPPGAPTAAAPEPDPRPDPDPSAEPVPAADQEPSAAVGTIAVEIVFETPTADHPFDLTFLGDFAPASTIR